MSDEGLAEKVTLRDVPPSDEDFAIRDLLIAMRYPTNLARCFELRRGTLDRDQVTATIKSSKGFFNGCYGGRLAERRLPNGEIEMQFLIMPMGNVGHADVRSSTFDDYPMEHCVVRQLMMLRFPKPAGSGVVLVRYPFAFRRSAPRPSPTPDAGDASDKGH